MNEKHTCKRCGGPLNISVTIEIPGTATVADDGEIVIFDEQKPYIREVQFLECLECGANGEETGYFIEGVIEPGYETFYLREIEDDEIEVDDDWGEPPLGYQGEVTS